MQTIQNEKKNDKKTQKQMKRELVTCGTISSDLISV